MRDENFRDVFPKHQDVLALKVPFIFFRGWNDIVSWVHVFGHGLGLVHDVSGLHIDQ